MISTLNINFTLNILIDYTVLYPNLYIFNLIQLIKYGCYKLVLFLKIKTTTIVQETFFNHSPIDSS